MKNTCLRLALFILLGTALLPVFSQKALAKDSYGITWTVQATPSAVAVDLSDNIYYAGYLASGSAVEMNPYYTLDPSNQTSETKTATTGAIFLSKLNANLTYAKSYVIEADNPFITNDKNISVSLTKIATDSASNVYLLGSFTGNVNFDPTTATTGNMDFHSSNGETWPFLLKMNADGTYGDTYLWQNNNTTIRDMIIDKSDNIYLLGQAANNGVNPIDINLNPLGGNDPQTLAPGDTLGFYTRLKTGAPYTYDYSRTFKNTGLQHLEVDHIASTSAGNIFLYGVFSATTPMNFNGLGADDKTSSNNSDDLYLSEYDAGGTYLLTYVIGGTQNESAQALGIDNNDNVYYSGGFNSTVNFNPTGGNDSRTADITLPGQRFLSKLNNDGSYNYTLVWTSNTLNINTISFDNTNLMYLIGTGTSGTNYNPTGGADIQAGFGGNDGFMTVLNPDKTYNYTYIWGGAEDEKTIDSAFDSLNNFYIAGSSQSLTTKFDPNSSTITTFPTAGEWGYLTEFLTTQFVPPSPTPTTTPTDNSNPSNNSSNNSSSSGPQSFTCTSHAPAAPRIFQIAATADKSTLHFVPTIDQENSYTISYGLYSDAEMYNVTFDYSDKSGAIPYTINALDANKAYYFKVRANNGCMAGNWSQTLSIKTPASGTAIAYPTASNTGAISAGGTSVGGSCSQYTVVPGDSLWKIAQKLLGAGNKYLQVWNANKTAFPSLNSSSIIRSGWTLSVGC